MAIVLQRPTPTRTPDTIKREGPERGPPRQPTGMSGPNEQNPLVEMCVRTSGEVYKLWLLFIDHRNGKKVENREESMECETGASEGS